MVEYKRKKDRKKRREEQRNISASNPVQMEILKILRELKKKSEEKE